MNLPEEQIIMRGRLFADGPKGVGRQEYRNEEYGVTLVATRPDRKTPFASAWSADCLPGAEFQTYALLRDAYNRFEGGEVF